MSRLDEAIRRSRSSKGVSQTPSEEKREPFQSPWEFGDNQAPSSSTPTPTPSSVDKRDHAAAVIRGFNSQWKERLVVSPSADPILVEQFRRLAATLYQAQTANGTKTVLISSASPGDGKTLTAINLALILSESYRRRVLLVDADLRRPSIRDVSGFPNVIGLADGLKAKTEQKLTVFQLTPHLSLLPAGRPEPDPMGSLTSERMRRILTDAANSYEWVILDAPPVGTVADASILADMVDAALLVIRAGRSECGLTQKAIEALGRDRILGVLLNGAEGVAAKPYAYYYQPAGDPAHLAGE
jgi:protein-tyrosine kinase